MDAVLCYRHLVASVVYVKEILAKLGVYFKSTYVSYVSKYVHMSRHMAVD